MPGIKHNNEPTYVTKADGLKMMKKRQQGMYVVAETENEILVTASQFREDPRDIVTGLNRAMGVFTCFNKGEWADQVRHWRTLGNVVLRPYNIHKVQLGRYGDFWLFTIQIYDKDGELEDTGLCPVAMALGYMVTGLSYYTPCEAITDQLLISLMPAAAKYPAEDEDQKRDDCGLCDGTLDCKYGNNPAPLKTNGRNDVCCDTCNATKVIPARMAKPVAVEAMD
jgi:hypothetical protein